MWLAAASLTAHLLSPAPQYFVRVEGLDFVAGCNKFYVAGWNQWEVVEAAAGAPYLSGASIPVNMTGPQASNNLQLYCRVAQSAAGRSSPCWHRGVRMPPLLHAPMQLVHTLMDAAKAAGLNTMRTWVHPVNPQYALQVRRSLECAGGWLFQVLLQPMAPPSWR